jgi:hypothetical protein
MEIYQPASLHHANYEVMASVHRPWRPALQEQGW